MKSAPLEIATSRVEAAVPAWVEEILHHDERTKITRRRLPDGSSFVYKQPLGPWAGVRLSHERALLQHLAGVEGVSRLAGSQPAHAIALEDDTGIALSQWLLNAPLTMPVQLEIALVLSRIVAAVHRCGVVHKDINPGNILVSGPQRKITLINFDLASHIQPGRPQARDRGEAAGTLAYLAPEQTGRTGRAVDLRSDLYSLGATLYELVTGRAPFTSEDPLQLIRDQLTSVPMSPAVLDPGLPTSLSEIILRLLEKEPDRRYQSADGLAHDLARLRDALACGETAGFTLGERDFALRLLPPLRLVGRDPELGALYQALADVVGGAFRGLLIAGAPGIGKTALCNELRPAVTARRGWFISGKFDAYRHEATSAVMQALHALGRLLLAEPEVALAQHRAQLVRSLGPNVGLVTAALPEFLHLLGPQPAVELLDPLETQARLIQVTSDLLRVIASPQRPLVLVLDDLQWASPQALRLVEELLAASALPGMLLVGTYRDSEVDVTHALVGLMARCQLNTRALRQLQLRNLTVDDLGMLVGAMLRLPPQPAAKLAEALYARSAGNPFDTVELIHALRRDNLLVADETGWRWDATTILRYMGDGSVVDLLAASIAALPLESQALLDSAACLGGSVALDLLQCASGLSGTALETQLVPAIDQGLLVVHTGPTGVVCLVHDRVRQVIHARMAPRQRSQLQLALARRLATRAEFELAAAEHYRGAIDAVHADEECRHAAELFRAVANRARQFGNFAEAEAFLVCALVLLSRPGLEVAPALLTALHAERHAALYAVGRHDEADALFAAIEGGSAESHDWVDVVCVQVASLSNRGLQSEAVALGLVQLAKLGVVPRDSVSGLSPESRAQRLEKWLGPAQLVRDLQRPEVTDPRVFAAAKLIAKLIPPAFFVDGKAAIQLMAQARRLWGEHGPCAPLLVNFSGALHFEDQQQRLGYDAVRHGLAVGEARGYELQTSWLRHAYALLHVHWFEPLQNAFAQAQRAREGLLRGGDLQMACFTHFASIAAQLDSAATLDDCAEDIDTGLVLAARTANGHARDSYLAYRQLVRTLRGETAMPGSFLDAEFDEISHLVGLATNPMAAAHFHICRGLAATLFDDAAALAHHAAAAMPFMAYIRGFYSSALAYLLQGLALAQRLATTAPADRAALLAELRTVQDWLLPRADDAPQNFGHLARLLEAERARAMGDHWVAATAFDAALREVAERGRPWHHALITERAAQFHMAHGLEHAGRRLMSDARLLYDAWGAVAKVRHLEQRFSHVCARPGPSTPMTSLRGSTHVSADVIDLLGILRASQALSSETSLQTLRTRVAELLSAMTGASAVSIALWHEASNDWCILPEADGGPLTIPLATAVASGMVPLSAFSYAARTREPLLVEDATRDDRFARDPYLVPLQQCSLMLVPIESQGAPRAILLLENRLSRNAFTAARLDAVKLIAGQLAVSLDNVLLYESLERKVTERTEALAEANQRLEHLSVTDPLTGLANRRRFAAFLEAECLRALRPKSSIGLAMIDIDQFKPYNDHYGHTAGDACLCLVANALATAPRLASDLIARYGGEEFVLVLPDTDLAGVRTVAERARAAVQALHEPHLKSGYGIVTVSIGIAAFVSANGGNAESSLRLADMALYEAKRLGRNRIAIAGS